MKQSHVTRPPPVPADVTEQLHFIERAERQLKDWQSRIEALTHASLELEGEAQAAATEEIRALRAKLGAARHKLNTHKTSHGEAWMEAKAGLETLWKDVKALFMKRGVRMTDQDEVTERHFL